MIKVDSSVSVPERLRNKYPWESLKVGDSFFAPVGKSNNLGSAKNRAQKIYGYKLTYRTCIEDGVEGVRVWRIE